VRVRKDLDRYRQVEARLWEKFGVTPVERWVTLASGGAVRVQEIGSGDPLLFIHGASVAGTSWCSLAAALDGFRCILLDRPGCGLSDPIAGGPLATLHDVESYADRLVPEVLDALELDRATLMSTSYGGLFAFRGAAAAPARIDRIVEYSWLIGAPTDRAPLSMRLGAIPGMKSVMTRMPVTRGVVKSLLRQVGMKRAVASGTFDDDMIEWLLALLRHTDTLRNEMQSLPAVITPIRGTNRELLLTDELLARLAMPVLFLWGDEDTNGGAAVARGFAPRLPNAQLEIIPEAGHAPWIDELEICAQRTREFLAS
jgi:2-hydroxy-6-oxonona-2,4-dienedioate hydrolase